MELDNLNKELIKIYDNIECDFCTKTICGPCLNMIRTGLEYICRYFFQNEDIPIMRRTKKGGFVEEPNPTLGVLFEYLTKYNKGNESSLNEEILSHMGLIQKLGNFASHAQDEKLLNETDIKVESIVSAKNSLTIIIDWFYKYLQVKNPISRTKHWQTLLEKCKINSNRRIDSAKYNPNLYVNRTVIESEIDNFLHSDKVGFVLIGNSGMGKTNLLSFLLDNWQKKEYPALLINSSTLSNKESNFKECIKEDIGYKLDHEIEQILYDINHHCEKENKYFILLVDALNEVNHPKELIFRINELLTYTTKGKDESLEIDLKRIKVIVTSRIQVWKQVSLLIQNVLDDLYYLDDGKPFKLSEFSKGEQENAYHKYENRYSLQTKYENLKSINRKLLRDPYHLRIVSEEYEGMEIPEIIRIDDLFKKMTERYDIEMTDSIDGITGLMYNKNSDKLLKKGIRNEDKDLYINLFVEKEKEVTVFQKILDENILQDFSDNEKTLIKFTYDRYLEYRICELIKDDVENKDVDITGLVNFLKNKIDISINKRFNVLWGALDKTFSYLKNNENEK